MADPRSAYPRGRASPDLSPPARAGGLLVGVEAEAPNPMAVAFKVVASVTALSRSAQALSGPLAGSSKNR